MNVIEVEILLLLLEGECWFVECITWFIVALCGFKFSGGGGDCLLYVAVMPHSSLY